MTRYPRFNLPQISFLSMRFVFLMLLLLSLAGAAQAQVTTTSGKTPAGVAPGAPAGSYSLSGFENVNLYSGNLNFSLPLLKIGGRGSAATSINLTINSTRWQMERMDTGMGGGGGGNGTTHQLMPDNEHYYELNEISLPGMDSFYTNEWHLGQGGLPPDFCLCGPPDVGNYIPPPPPDLTPITNVGGGGGQWYMMPTPAQWGGLRVGYGPGVLQGRWIGKGAMTSGNHTTLLRFTFTAADGTEYELRDIAYGGEPVTRTGTGQVNRGTVFKSADGVSVVFISDQNVMEIAFTREEHYVYPTGYLMLADGSRYRVEEGLVKWIQDRQGNKLFFEYGVDTADANTYNKLVKVTDSLGREVFISYAHVPNSNTPTVIYDEIKFRNFGGTDYQYIKIWRGKLEQTLRPDMTLKSYGALFPGGIGSSSTQLYNPEGMASSIELPDGRRYYIEYNSYGEIARVELPTGGAIEYDYNVFDPQGQPWSGVYDLATIYRRVSRRRTYSGGTTLESLQYYKPHYSGDGTETNQWKTEVVVEQHDMRNGGDTLVTYDKHYFYGYPVVALAARQNSPNYFYSDWREGKEYQSESFNIVNGVATTPLCRVKQVWDKRAAVPWSWPGPAYLAPAVDPRIIETWSTLLETNQTMMRAMSYSANEFNDVTETTEYDYSNPGEADTHGALLRRTQTDFLTSTAYTNDNTYLLHLPTEQRTYTVNPATGAETLNAKTQTIYDEAAYPVLNYGSAPVNWEARSATVRGNATTVRHWLNTNNSYLETHIQLDQCGNVRYSWDARGQKSETQYSAEHNAYAFAVSSITPIPDNGGGYSSTTALVTSQNFDFWTGLMTSMTDANGQIFTIEYNDLLNRPTRVVRAWDGAWTSYEYGDAIGNLYLRTQSSLDATHATDAYQYFDGLGRSVRTFQSEGGTWLVSDTQYDALSRVVRVSNPYRASSLSGAVNPSDLWTTTTYDALGRLLVVTTPDNAQVRRDYDGARILVTDQANRQRVSRTNALGQLIDVWEIKPSDAATEAISFPNHAEVLAGYRTSYSYDGLGNLRKVVQGAQARYFSYDSLSRLIRVRNPEQSINSSLALPAPDAVTSNNSWSLSYAYDANGNVSEKIDARGIKSLYVYDNLNRNTRITYENDPANTPSVTRYFDGATNGRGFLWKSERAGDAGTLITVEGYDLGGRPLARTQQFRVGTSWSRPYRVQRSYNQEGRVTAQTYPSGHTVNYSLDAAGRLTSFEGNLGDGVQRSYASGISYDDGGRMQQERYGTLIPLYQKLRYNVRGQLYDVRLSTMSRAASETDWNRGCLAFYYSAQNPAWGQSASDNNGNLIKAESYIPLTSGGYYQAQDNYSYDALNRLTAVSETPYLNGQAQTGFTQAYIYDRYGNRTINAAGTSSTVNHQGFAVDAATNRLGVPAGIAKTMSYDAAGNLTFDNYTGMGARGYNAESRMISATDNSSQTSLYTYDADGRRVRRQTAAEGEVWQVYGMDDELLAEYQAMNASFMPSKEYGYRAGQLLVTAANGDEQRLTRFVQQLYHGALAREAEKSELSDGMNALASAGEQGQTQLLDEAKNIAAALFASPEYDGRARSNEQYVSDLYWTYFDRSSDIYTIAYWVGRLESGGADHVTREQLRHICEQWVEYTTLVTALRGGNIAGENERTEHFLWNVYLGATGAVPAPSTLQPQIELLNTASAQGKEAVITQAEQICRGLLTSPDYQARNRSDNEYIADLYQVFWHRAPDDASLSEWARTLSAEERTSVLDSFATSQAFRELAGTLYRETLWLIPDQLGTPRIIAERTGTPAGIKRHDYLPFGEELMAGVSGRTNGQGYVSDTVRQQFTSKERDDETGLDYFGARFMSSVQGRFTGLDPLPVTKESFLNPQRWNLYVYVNNNPLVAFDPDGGNGQGTGGDKVISVFLDVTMEQRNILRDEDTKKVYQDPKPNWQGTKKELKGSGYALELYGSKEITGEKSPNLITENAFENALKTSDVVIYIGHGRGNTVDGRFNQLGIQVVLTAYSTTGKQNFASGVESGKPDAAARVIGNFSCDSNSRTSGYFNFTGRNQMVITVDSGPDGLTNFSALEYAVDAFIKTYAKTGGNVEKANAAANDAFKRGATGENKKTDKVETKRVN